MMHTRGRSVVAAAAGLVATAMLLAACSATSTGSDTSSASAKQVSHGGRVACTKKGVSINTTDATVTVTGNCPAIFVQGSGNQISAQSVQSISVSGNDNSVSWDMSNGNVSVSDSGTGNHFSGPGYSPPMPPPIG